MAALVEPLGLERGKRSGGPVWLLSSVGRASQMPGTGVVRVGGARPAGVGGSGAERTNNTPPGVGVQGTGGTRPSLPA